MAKIGVTLEVLNQKGTPALYTDIFANRPTYGFTGRLFFSTDTSAIYEDTGSAWTLIANVAGGVGTLEQVTTNGNSTDQGITITANGLTSNQVVVSGGTSLQFLKANGTLDNNTYLTTSSAASTYQPLITLTTTGTSGAATFSGNTLNIPNYGTALSGYLPLSGGTLTGTLIGTGIVLTNGITASSFNTIGGTSSQFLKANGTLDNNTYLTTSSAASTYQPLITLTTTGTSGNATFTANTLNIPNYGTALSGYLPLSGGTLTGALSGTSASFSSSVTASSFTDSYITMGAAQINRTGGYVELQYSGAGGVRFFGNTSYPITFAASTGAATFSSSVTAAGLSINNATAAALQLASFIGSGNGSNFSINSANAASQYLEGALAGDVILRTETNNLRIGTVLSTGVISFSNTTNEYMRISGSSGNVLIGTTTDNGQKLLVNGTASVTQIITSQTWLNASTFNQTFTISPANGAGTTIISNNSTNYTWTMEPAISNNRMYILRTIGSNTITINTSGSDVIINNAGLSVSSLTMTSSTGAIILQSDGSSRWLQLK